MSEGFYRNRTGFRLRSRCSAEPETETEPEPETESGLRGPVPGRRESDESPDFESQRRRKGAAETMILILSNALAKRWKVKPVPLSEAPPCHPALVWRADWFQVGRRRSNIICVNEESCFSFVLLDQRQMQFKKTMLNILNRIGDTFVSAGVSEQHIMEGILKTFLVKHPNPRVAGTMTDQKVRYEWDLLDADQDITNLAELERRNNLAPLKILGMKRSAEVFAETVKKDWPAGVRFEDSRFSEN